MSEYRETNDRVAEIIDRLDRCGIGWQKYDAAPENRAAWKNREMKALGDIGLLCAEICEDYVMGEAWILAQDKLKQYDPARTRKDGTGPMPLGEYIKMHVASKWLKKKVKEEDEKDPGERRQEDADRKRNERERAKGNTKTDEDHMPKRVSLEAIMGWGEDRNGTRNEILLKKAAISVEEEVIGNLELAGLILTMMAMSLNFGDYRKRLKKEEKPEQKRYIKMCYTEKLVCLEMLDYVRLSYMDKVIQGDILKAMLKTYYWYWADGEMFYNAEQERQPIKIKKLVTPKIKELKWMKTKDGGHKGWLDLAIPIKYLKDSQEVVVDKPRISEARKGYQQDLYRLYKMAYGRERRPQLERL